MWELVEEITFMNELQLELKNTISKFCAKNLEPFLEEDDENQFFRKDIYNSFGELGLTGVTLPEKYGGANLSYQDLCVVLEEIANQRDFFLYKLHYEHNDGDYFLYVWVVEIFYHLLTVRA